MLQAMSRCRNAIATAEAEVKRAKQRKKKGGKPISQLQAGKNHSHCCQHYVVNGVLLVTSLVAVIALPPCGLCCVWVCLREPGRVFQWDQVGLRGVVLCVGMFTEATWGLPAG